MKRRRKLTTLELKRLWAQQSNLCANCENELDETAQLDHMWALELGGPDHPANIRAVCPNCHARKTLRDNWLKKKRDAYNRRMEKEQEREQEQEKEQEQEQEQEKEQEQEQEQEKADEVVGVGEEHEKNKEQEQNEKTNKRRATHFLNMTSEDLDRFFQRFAPE